MDLERIQLFPSFDLIVFVLLDLYHIPAQADHWDQKTLVQTKFLLVFTIKNLKCNFKSFFDFIGLH